MRRGVVQRVACYWLCGSALALLIALVAYAFGGSPFALRRFAPSIARGISPGFPDGSMWEWQEERSTFSVVVTSWVRSDDELKAYQLGVLPGFEAVVRPRWWCYGMERLMPPVESAVRDHDVPFVTDFAYGWPIVSLSSRRPGPELLREMAEGRRADDGELLGVGSNGLPRAQIGWEHHTFLSRWGWNSGVWPTRILWPGVVFGGAWWGVLLALPELALVGIRRWKGTKHEAQAIEGLKEKGRTPIGMFRRAVSALVVGVSCAFGIVIVASAFEAVWLFRLGENARFEWGETPLRENGRAWRWTVVNSLARTTVNSDVEDAARIEQWKDMHYGDGVVAVEGASPWWSISIEQPVPPVLHGTFDEMMPSVVDDAFGFPWRCMARRIECYDIRFNKGMKGTPPVTAGMGRTSGFPLLVSGVRIEIPVLGGVTNSGWWPTRVLWFGLLADLVFFAAIWLLIGFTWRRAVWLKEERRRRKGLCAGCCYRMTGIEIGAKCPECGREREGTSHGATLRPA
ncbi:MAG: hypothetical protein J0L78_13655 [Planctomycetes bacterium]|nr:hypothetical protein [Planctomycetota bacterium]